MKTQISSLRAGFKNQLLNPSIDYSLLPKATSHIGHAGTNEQDVKSIWDKVVLENNDAMNVIVNGLKVELKASRSLSGKSVIYYAEISIEDLENKFLVTPSKYATPYLSIQHGNVIIAHNGRNSHTYVCPSLVEIID